MFIINKLNIINLILCVIMAELKSTTISDYNEDNSSTNRNNKYMYDKALKLDVVKTDLNNNNEQLNQQLTNNRNFKADEELNADNLVWDTEEKLLEYSMFRLKRESEENKCLLDSLKLALMWWCYTNGTLQVFSNDQQQYDLSHQNIAHDAKALNIISKSIRNKTRVLALSLAYNNFTRAPFLTLNMMANSLKFLSLRGNPFMNVKLNDGDTHCILNENDFKYLKDRDNNGKFASKRKELAWANFPLMPALTELDISQCNIEYIEKLAFRNLTNLKSLFMSDNKILNIPADTFLYTPNLQVLDLSFTNVYDSLINHIYASPNLESIMKFFYGVNIEKHFFNYLPKLIYLDLSHTKLRTSSAVAFTDTGATLKYLSLCYTSFPVFGNGILKNSSLIGLDLSGNANAALSLNEEVFLSLSDSLNILFFEKANLKDLAWLKPLKNLRFLALAGNNINILQADHFLPLKQLQILDLSSNQVSNWYSRVFQHNEHLVILSLRHNNINIITSEMLKDFSMLFYLSLGSNNFICDCILRDLVDVSSINNQQAQCKRKFFQIINDQMPLESIYLPELWHNAKLFVNTSLTTLNIPSLLVTQNLYKFKQMTQGLQQNPGSPSKRFILNALRNYNKSQACQQYLNANTSFGLKINNSTFKLQLLDYKEEQYWCFNETRKESLTGLNCQRSSLIENIEEKLNNLTTYVLVSVASLILIGLFGILAYTKRWHIYYYYSSLKSAALLSVVSKDKLNHFHNLCDQNPNMIYDIFVSYCQSDRDWIVQEFMSNLEKTGDISICLHERDFQVGVTILDNIVSCMERSKVLMLIISSNFLLSHWCQFEMQLAHHHILDLNKDNLILVFLEDIPRSKRPKNLQFLMNVKTYIKWPGNGKCKDEVHPEDRKLFWKRLKRSLRNIGLNSLDSKA